MQKILYIIAALIIIVIIAMFVLGVVSKKGQALGLKDGHLQACTSTDNCVISERVNDSPATVEVYTFEGDKAAFLIKLATVVESMGGEIVTAEGDYIAATFTSKVFGFIDDLELRVSDEHQLHFRSSSRVGRKDFGANKKRIEALKQLLKEQ